MQLGSETLASGVQVDANGASVNFGVLDTMSGKAQVNTNGGHLRIGGLDGDLLAQSGGGNLNVSPHAVCPNKQHPFGVSMHTM